MYGNMTKEDKMASVGCDIADVRVLFFDKGNRKNERLWLYGGGFQTMITVGILIIVAALSYEVPPT